MDPQPVELRFEGLSSAESSMAAQKLQSLLAEAFPEVQASLRRDRPEAQDMGATLVLLLGTPAVIAVAKGIAAYLGKRGDRAGTLVIDRVAADGSTERIRFDGASADAARIADALRAAPGKVP